MKLESTEITQELISEAKKNPAQWIKQLGKGMVVIFTLRMLLGLGMSIRMVNLQASSNPMMIMYHINSQRESQEST